MGRPPTERPVRDGAELRERLRERVRRLGQEGRLTTGDRRRIESILGQLEGLEGVDIDDLLKDPDLVRPGDGTGRDGDFQGPMLEIGEVSELFAEVARPDRLPDANALDFVTGNMMNAIRRRRPEVLPLRPVPTGRKGPRLPVPAKPLSQLVRLAAIRRSDEAGSVVWDDGVNQLLVRADGIETSVDKGQVVVTIPVEADGISASMQVPFAVGREDRLSGLLAATADRPAGHARVARVWGEALIALAYGALMDAADSIAGASGRDEANDRLVPRALMAGPEGLVVEAQARFRFKEGAP
ncbi:hypothetical protein SAMN05444722_1520 [Rhodovulum sp. ES.010]|uniref:hypothetical protein n=1 Tax=Rhodovulum sp. ES.010 TaxID=1882821 RepID=UPI0009279E21|nr:hypothetical protein [Rhodovulum sp. ES.010]SIO33812.1 hypothetical protein SAMN05444722_1520 [Rhodovulum sp. ES.010]